MKASVGRCRKGVCPGKRSGNKSDGIMGDENDDRTWVAVGFGSGRGCGVVSALRQAVRNRIRIIKLEGVRIFLPRMSSSDCLVPTTPQTVT